MTIIVTRAGKGSELTWDELDANFTNLNTAKVEILPVTAGEVAYASTSGTLTGASNFTFDGATLTTSNLTYTGTLTPGPASIFTTANLAYTGTFTGGTGVVDIGSGQLYKDSAGNVGIGTTSPLANTNQVSVNVNGTSASRYELLVNGTRTGYVYADTSTMQIGTVANLPLQVMTNGTEKVRVDTSGKVWQQVNATTTSNYFAWGDATTAYAQIGGYRDSATTGHLELYTLNAGISTEAGRIDSIGNTYIATGNLWKYTPTPTALLAGANAVTPAQLQGELFTVGAVGGNIAVTTAVTMTLPLGSALDTTFVGAPGVNIGFDFYVANYGTSAGIVTVAVSTGVSNGGAATDLTIAIATKAQFRLRRTAASTYILYRVN